jgi:hypothetical protein
MGILLTFMFVWNMIGALVFLPAIASLLYKRDPKLAVVQDTATPNAKKDDNCHAI